MKMIRLVISVVCSVFLAMQVSAQFLSFDKVVYEYGIISSKNVNTQAIFTCTNRGNDPIVITKIVPSSEAITCELTRDTLAASTRASILVSFDATKIESMFSEHIDVYTTDKMLGKIILTLKGTVKDLDENIEKQYPGVFDVVRLSKMTIAYGKINYPTTAVDTITIYNPQDTAVTMIFPNVPNYMSVQMYPEVIQPNSTALMIVSYNSELRKEWGAIYDKLYLGFKGKKVNYKQRIAISGSIVDDFSQMTKRQLKKAPKIKLENDIYNLGTIQNGDKVACEFHFTNEGKSTLEVRKIKTSCGCTAGTMEKTSYEKGENGTVKVTFNSRNKHGKIRQRITLITNDPVNTETIMYIEGEVLNKSEENK